MKPKYSEVILKARDNWEVKVLILHMAEHYKIRQNRSENSILKLSHTKYKYYLRLH